MRRKPPSSSRLILPGESAGAIRCELNVIWRVCINEIVSTYLKLCEIGVHELPVMKCAAVRQEGRHVIYPLVLTKRHVESAAFTKPTEAVVAGAIQVIKELC